MGEIERKSFLHCPLLLWFGLKVCGVCLLSKCDYAYAICFTEISREKSNHDNL